jgi:hypothetical protein
MVVSDAQKRASKKYYEAHKEKVAEICRKYRDTHKEELNEKERNRMMNKYKTDEEHRARKLEQMKAYRERKKFEKGNSQILVN